MNKEQLPAEAFGLSLTDRELMEVHLQEVRNGYGDNISINQLGQIAIKNTKIEEPGPFEGTCKIND